MKRPDLHKYMVCLNLTQQRYNTQQRNKYSKYCTNVAVNEIKEFKQDFFREGTLL